MKIILIARVSDVEQRKALPAQKLKLEAYAKSKDMHSEYYEFDESAHTDVRRQFAKLVDNIKSQKERCIVAFDKIDRFTRDSSQEEVKALNTLVRQDKIELHFPSDNLYITKNSPASDLFRLGIGMALAKYYSDSIRDNVIRRFDQLLNDKIWPGYAPIGYRNINLGTAEKPLKDIIIDDDRAPHIVKMFEMRATGIPYAIIAKEVTELGLTSKSGKILNKSAVEKIIRNPFYYGVMTYMGKQYPHKYEPLISRHLFNQCQLVRDKRHSQHATYDSLDFTFKEFVKCKICKCTVSSFKSKDITYLKCSGAKGKCGNQNTAINLILPDVIQTIADVPIPEDVLQFVIDELKSRHDNQQEYYTHNIEDTRKEYDKIKERLKALTYERLDGRITTDLYDEIVTELTTKQQELNDRLIALTDSNKSFMVTASYLLDLAQKASELFKNSSERLQQKLLKFVLSNVELSDKKLSYTVNNPYKTFINLNKKALAEPKSANWCG